MLPLIPILAVVALCGGGATLFWYDSLSQFQKAAANRLTADYARSLFGKAVIRLTEYEAGVVQNRVRAHFVD